MIIRGARRVALVLFFALVLGGWVVALGARQSPGQVVVDLPVISFLGFGPGKFEIPADEYFIVKRSNNRYFIEPGPVYQAKNNERVWDSDRDTSEVPLFDEEYVFGPIVAPCVVNFVQIDDDPDTRINRFFLDGKMVHEVTQGFVTYGRFELFESGNLTFFAEDSVGLLVQLCEEEPSTLTPTLTPTATGTTTVTPTASASPTPTATGTLTSTLTATPTATGTLTGTLTVTPTATGTLTETPTVTNTPTLTPSPSATPTMTMTPTDEPTATVTPTHTPEVTLTPTPTRKPPRLLSCLRINFDVGGDVARRGAYVVKEVGGRVLAIWEADNGWTDSDWIEDFDITFPSVYVQVFYYRGDGSEPVEMTILNPAPGTSYGWLTRGRCHSLEVAWPD